MMPNTSSATFATTGAAVSLLGINLQIPLQNTLVLSSFAGLLVLLSLSMFGFYVLRIPGVLRTRSQPGENPHSGTYLGAGILGILSAVLISPLVARSPANALAYVGQSANPVLGGSALFAFGLGMGMPVLVIGTLAGRLLPHARSSINVIKAVLGVSLIAAAISLLERIIPPWTSLLLWSGLFVVCAIYMGALEVIPSGASGWRRLWKGAGLIMLTYGVLLMAGVAGGGGDLLQPLRGVTP